MALIQTVKLHSTSADGRAFPNLFTEVKIPDLKRKYEAYKGGGMDTAVHLDMGGEPIEMELTFNGKLPKEIVKMFARPSHTGVLWRHAGWYTDQDTNAKYGVEIVMRGRFTVDNPATKTGEQGSGKIKVFASYLKYSENGEELIEIDAVAGVNKVGGEDTLEEARNFIGI